MPTLPPRKKTLPGKLSPRALDTSAFNFTNPKRPPPKRSVDWMSIWRRLYGSRWNSCDGFCCRARECCSVESQVLNAGKESRSSWLRSGVLLTRKLDPGIVNVDMVMALVVPRMSVCRGCEGARFRCRAVSRSRGNMDLLGWLLILLN